ncbi:hypothetical protein APHAL10511_002739 [Amanita phalloides]|nr:hypothetical protein APHAL10511_002739 [Amanita phalloides]
MGNSASTPGAPAKDPPPEGAQTHRSLRVKRKSLELPDLASLSLTPTSPYARARHPTPPKSACIPIPHAVNSGQPRTRPQNNLSATDMLVTEPSTHIPFPPPTRGTANATPPYFRGAHPARTHRSSSSQRHPQRMAHQRLQELYSQSNDVPAPPPSSLDSDPLDPTSSRFNGFVPEVVHSSIPIGLLKGESAADGSSPKVSTDDNDLVPIKIIWRGGGKSVFLARAGDNGWKGRQAMERESAKSQVYSTIVSLRRGTHHFRFLVDDQWRVADDLPTAVDDQGTLANYVAVRLSYSPPKSYPAASPLIQRHIPGQSFWSAASSADGDMPEPSRQLHHSSSLGHHSAVWTSEIPPELIEAAREEEAYLEASAGQYEANGSKGGGTTYVTGFVPAPNIPPAPGLPRHLDKLILNTKMSSSSGSSTPGKGSSSGKTKVKDKERGDKENKRHRDGKERDKRIPPPAPPPSEDGSGPVDATNPDPSSFTAMPLPNGMFASDVTVTPATPDPSAGIIVPSTTSTSLDFSARSMPIGIDPANTPALTDDASVLSVPSHVVLHHLCTSAIRNGVLAVANTTRYRQKYLTTVYYKPT